jgi:XXXCH domain-containing protein
MALNVLDSFFLTTNREASQMTFRARGIALSTVALTVLSLSAISGCGETAEGDQAGPGGARKASPIKAAMGKLAKGPQSLTSVIGKELKESEVDWPKIQPQTSEFVKVASSMITMTPTKGSQESWKTLTTAYAGTAEKLELAAKDKDKDAAVAAHKTLSESCKSCHSRHRGGPGG